MISLVVSRLIQGALTLILLAAASYALIGLMPGDPIEAAIIGDPRLGPEDAAALRRLFDLDRSLSERFLAWAARALTGEFGHSRLFARPVTQLLPPAMLATLQLTGASLLLGSVAGILAGALAAAYPRRAPERLVNLAAFVSASLPTFWLGILLMLAFAVSLGWLPAGGPPDQPGLVATLRHLALPVTTLAFATFASYARQTSSALKELGPEPFLRTARAKGASASRVLWAHAGPNASIPVLTVAALDVGHLMSGALVVETVFAWPGMGKLLYDAVLGNDFNLALVALLTVAALTLLASLAADLLQRAIDPRLRA